MDAAELWLLLLALGLLFVVRFHFYATLRFFCVLGFGHKTRFGLHRLRSVRTSTGVELFDLIHTLQLLLSEEAVD